MKPEGAEAYPLAWPQGWPRTAERNRSRFDGTFAKIRDELWAAVDQPRAFTQNFNNVSLWRSGIVAHRPSSLGGEGRGIQWDGGCFSPMQFAFSRQ